MGLIVWWSGVNSGWCKLRARHRPRKSQSTTGSDQHRTPVCTLRLRCICRGEDTLYQSGSGSADRSSVQITACHRTSGMRRMTAAHYGKL